MSDAGEWRKLYSRALESSSCLTVRAEQAEREVKRLTAVLKRLASLYGKGTFAGVEARAALAPTEEAP